MRPFKQWSSIKSPRLPHPQMYRDSSLHSVHNKHKGPRFQTKEERVPNQYLQPRYKYHIMKFKNVFATYQTHFSKVLSCSTLFTGLLLLALFHYASIFLVTVTLYSLLIQSQISHDHRISRLHKSLHTK